MERSQLLEDFSLESVPLNQRKTWLNLAVVWIGIAVVMSAIFRGMMIGLGLGKISSVVVSYLLGEIILIAMMGLTGYIGAKTGFSTSLIANFSFGRIGAILISLSIAFSLIGWFGVQAAFFARTIQFYFGTHFSLPLFSFLCGILMMIPAIFGIRGLSVLSWIASPFMILIFIWGIIKMGFHFLPSETLITLASNHQPDPYPLTLGDTDGDGFPDLIANGHDGSDFRLFYFQSVSGTLVESEQPPVTFVGPVVFGDFDRDNDLDMVGLPVRHLYTNLLGPASSAPGIPSDLSATVSEQEVELTWSAPSDAESSPSALSYEVRLGTAPGQYTIISGVYGTPLLGTHPMGHVSIGQPGRRFSLAEGTYYWQVRAIDTSLRAGDWSTEASFTTYSYEFVTKWGGLGSGDGQFSSPLGVAVDSSGYVYVADSYNHRIQKFQKSVDD